MNAPNQHRYGHAEPLPPKTLEALDPPIRRAVEVLHNHGIETFESCQGGDGHAYAEPTVRFHIADSGEPLRACAIARMYRLPVRAVRVAWAVNDGLICGPYGELTFALEET